MTERTLDSEFTIRQIHDDMTAEDLSEVWADIIRLQNLVDEETLGAVLQAICPGSDEQIEVEPCPYEEGTQLALTWGAREYAKQLRDHKAVLKLSRELHTIELALARSPSMRAYGRHRIAPSTANRALERMQTLGDPPEEAPKRARRPQTSPRARRPKN